MLVHCLEGLGFMMQAWKWVILLNIKNQTPKHTTWIMPLQTWINIPSFEILFTQIGFLKNSRLKTICLMVFPNPSWLIRNQIHFSKPIKTQGTNKVLTLNYNLYAIWNTSRDRNIILTTNYSKHIWAWNTKFKNF